MIVAAACILVQSFREAPRPSPELNPDVNPAAIATETSAHNVLTLRLVLMVLLITGYIFPMPAVGFIVASAAFLFLSFSYLWRKSLMVSLLITACSVASVYFIFRQLFQVVLPSGTLLQGLF